MLKRQRGESCLVACSQNRPQYAPTQSDMHRLQAEFTDLVGENSPFLSALLKVYKKKAGGSDVF